MSERPEYNSKIKKMFALAPAIFITHSRYWPFSKLSTVYGTMIDLFGYSRFLPETFRTWLNILGYGCAAMEPLCDNFYFFVAGYNPKQMNSSRTAVITSHTPDTVSSKTISHFLQIMRSDRFQKYDYGFSINAKIYGQDTPPEYNLTKVTAPVVYFHSLNDIFATPKDIEKSRKMLPNLKDVILVEDELFSHIDFSYGNFADRLVYHKIINMILEDEITDENNDNINSVNCEKCKR